MTILTIFGVLTLAGGNDILAFYFSTELEALTILFRVLVLVLPVVAGVTTYRICEDRRAREAGSSRPGSPKGGVALRRTASGGFEEVEP